MRDQRSSARVSELSLVVEVGDDPDRPIVTIAVDGKAPFEAVAEGFHGFDPAEILGPFSPLLPTDPIRRIAVYRCSCGEPGCGVIAPTIERSPDGRRVSWTDFWNFVGVFDGPIADERDMDGEFSRSWELPDLHFDREQYEAEVARASADRSWETPWRTLARLVHERLREISLGLPPDLTLEWVMPAWQADGVEMAFEFKTRGHPERSRQQLLHLTSRYDDPERAADDIVDQLVRTAPSDRARIFGRRQPW